MTGLGVSVLICLGSEPHANDKQKNPPSLWSSRSQLKEALWELCKKPVPGRRDTEGRSTLRIAQLRPRSPC